MLFSDVFRIKFAWWKLHVSEVLVRQVDFVPGSAHGVSFDFGLAEPVSDVVPRLLCGSSWLAVQ